MHDDQCTSHFMDVPWKRAFDTGVSLEMVIFQVVSRPLIAVFAMIPAFGSHEANAVLGKLSDPGWCWLSVANALTIFIPHVGNLYDNRTAALHTCNQGGRDEWGKTSVLYDCRRVSGQ